MLHTIFFLPYRIISADEAIIHFILFISTCVTWISLQINCGSIVRVCRSLFRSRELVHLVDLHKFKRIILLLNITEYKFTIPSLSYIILAAVISNCKGVHSSKVKRA
jgi:hypothetical protein